MATHTHQEIVLLASASPRRSELLNQIQVKHHVIQVPAAPGEDEPRLTGESPLEYVLRTALDKADRAIKWIMTDEAKRHSGIASLATAGSSQSPIILTADTTVCIGEDILGKPCDEENAIEILRSLSGKTHWVHTAVVVSKGSRRAYEISSTEVTFDALTTDAIEHYVQTGEPFGKAGAYGIQGLAATFIRRIIGSYSGVMGLPLFETAQLLKKIRE